MHLRTCTALVGISAAMMAVPLVTAAQDTAPASSIFCPTLTTTLAFGARDATTGGQVSALQHFLSDFYDLNPADYITGYFGRLTRTNVQRFQCEKMSICSGNESTTGYGLVGARTRAAIAQNCGTQTTTTNTSPPPPPSNPTCTLSFNPSTITTGQSSTLTWASANATGGIISPGIGNVQANGSESISVLQTTTFNETFFGTNGSNAMCSATLTVGQATTNTCTPDPSSPQTQTLACPAGQTGAITQTRTSTCPGPTWSDWTTTSNTCVVGTTQPSITITAPSSGISVLQGSTLTVTWASANAPAGSSAEVTFSSGNASGQSYGNNPASGSFSWVVPAYPAGAPLTVGVNLWQNGSKIASAAVPISVVAQISGGTVTTPLKSFTASPSSGPAPLAVTISAEWPTYDDTTFPRIEFGDGVTIQLYTNGVNPTVCTDGTGLSCISVTHTYTSRGNFTAKWLTSWNTPGTAPVSVY